MTVTWLSINDVAQTFEVSRATVSAWIASGELRAEDHSRRRGGNKRLRIHSDDLEAFRRGRSTRPEPTQATQRKVRRNMAPRLVRKYAPAK